MNGILLVDKPVGWTSFDVVAKVRSTLRQSSSHPVKQPSSQGLSDSGTKRLVTTSSKVKVGHTGTLDPLASGLLVLLLGDYTKRAAEYSKLDKTYEVVMKLGQTSTTGDEEGEKTVVSGEEPSKQAVSDALVAFTGEILQTPPQYSAVKINGQRAYKLARAGKDFELEARKVTVYRLEVTDYTYPILKFTAAVSSGTYIRSLVEDIGNKLGTGAYMTGLVRTKVGKFVLKDAIKPHDLTAEHIYQHLVD